MKRLTLLALAFMHPLPLQQPSVRILTPAADDYVTGHVVVAISVNPGDETLTSLVVHANGMRVCRLVQPPFRCDWDAGVTVRMHQIRAVATFASGARVVDNVRTAAVDVAEGVAVRSVLVGATVQDWRGRAVPNLSRDAFELRVNSKVTPVTFFGAEELPLDVLVALDISGSMAKHLDDVRVAVRAFMSKLRTQDRLSIAAFNTGLFVLAPLGTPGPTHDLALSRLASFGGTAFHDALIAGLETLPASAGRRVMIFFSDGDDHLSQAPIDVAERALLADNVLLYVVAHGVARDQPRKGTLERLCERTGGRVVFVDDLSDLREAFAELVADLKSQYTLGFDPNPEAKGWQTIEVRLKEGRHRIRARQGYAGGS